MFSILLNFFFQDELEKCDAFVIVYSVVDKSSFTHAEHLLASFQDMDLIRTRPAILVANKIDLARSRAVSSQGMYNDIITRLRCTLLYLARDRHLYETSAEYIYY